MSEDSRELPDPSQEVNVRQVRGDGTPPVETTFHVINESEIRIDEQGRPLRILMASPVDIKAMVVGHLLIEGRIRTMDDFETCEPSPDDPCHYLVKLKKPPAEPQAAGQPVERKTSAVFITSSGSRCEPLPESDAANRTVGDTLRIAPSVIHNAMDQMHQRQQLKRLTRGTHAMGIFEPGGQLVAFAEDVGRHNALDKVIGQCVLAGRSPAGLGAVFSSRVSLEMTNKVATAGIEVIGSISAPTSLAVARATEAGVTVCSFVKDGNLTIFTHPHRIITDEQKTGKK